MMVKANMTERNLNLVSPLAQKATAIRITDTSASLRVASGAVSDLIGSNLRIGNVDSENTRSTRPITSTIRTSTTAIRTTRTSTTSVEYVPSADPSMEDLVQAYLACRKHKRNTKSALAFEQNLERNLFELHGELLSGSYEIGKSICFVITKPKPREVWAADFKDRVVHHLLYNKIGARFENGFIADSCACIKGRGTLYGAKRLDAKVRSITQNWSKPAYYLKLDLANFFVAINKDILWSLLVKKISEPFWLDLTHKVLFHDPRQNYDFQGQPTSIELVPTHKRLTSHPTHLGLPIGNLSSQFFANVYMNELDQFVKHQIGARHYIRYVDDFVLLHESARWLNDAKGRIEQFLAERLDAKINPKKTILQPIDRGVDFVGQVIKPWRRSVRRRNVVQAVKAIQSAPANDLLSVSNSYFGLLGQAKSHHDRATISRVVLGRGRSVNRQFTKTFRGLND
jgi:hypothetical protein